MHRLRFFYSIKLSPATTFVRSTWPHALGRCAPPIPSHRLCASMCNMSSPERVLRAPRASEQIAEEVAFPAAGVAATAGWAATADGTRIVATRRRSTPAIDAANIGTLGAMRATGAGAGAVSTNGPGRDRVPRTRGAVEGLGGGA